MRWFIRSQAVQFAVDAATDVVVVIENASNADTVASAAAQLLSQLPQVIASSVDIIVLSTSDVF